MWFLFIEVSSSSGCLGWATLLNNKKTTTTNKQKNKRQQKRYDLIDAFNSTSRYLDDLLNIDNIHFEHMVHRIYPAELQLNKANASDTEEAFLDLNLSIHNDIVSTKIHDKREDFNFYIVNLPFLDGDVPRRPSYGVYIYI